MKEKTKFIIATFSIVLLSYGFNYIGRKNTNGFVKIPEGNISIGDNSISMESFWILDHEVSNGEYLEFLTSLKKQDIIKYNIAKVDCEKWSIMLGEKFKKYTENYLSYTDFPVVNVSYEGAQMYCDWLTEEEADASFSYRLPSRNEWIYAASGGLIGKKYPWGDKLMDDKRQPLCNYYEISQELIRNDNFSNVYIDSKLVLDPNNITHDINSYNCNGFGLYNVVGNVAEMIDVKGVAMGGSWSSTGYNVKITSEFNYDEPSPFIGFRPVKVRKVR